MLWMILIGLVIIPNVKRRHKINYKVYWDSHVYNLTCDFVFGFHPRTFKSNGQV